MDALGAIAKLGLIIALEALAVVCYTSVYDRDPNDTAAAAAGAGIEGQGAIVEDHAKRSPSPDGD
jgi:hypothetical protein